MKATVTITKKEDVTISQWDMIEITKTTLCETFGVKCNDQLESRKIDGRLVDVIVRPKNLSTETEEFDVGVANEHQKMVLQLLNMLDIELSKLC